jgi:hypothetical protein
MLRSVSLVAVLCSIVVPSRTHAAPDPAAPEAPIRGDGQRSVGVGAEIGSSTGLGAALHLGWRQLGLYTAAGIVPLFITGNQHDGSRSITFDVYRAYAWNVDLYWMFRESARADLGISAGYSANSVLGSGGNVGIAFRYDLGEKIAFTLFGGLTVFPDAGAHLTAHGYPTTQDPSLPELQGGVNAGLVFYP